MISSPHRPAPRHAERRGTLYVGVLTTAMIVSLVGLSGLTVAQLGIRASRNTRDAENAALLARAAIEAGFRDIRDDKNWRTTRNSNVNDPSTPLALNGGTLTWRYVDSDGDFSNNPADGVRLYGIGQSNGATYVESVLLQPSEAGLSCLEGAFHCQSNITLGTTCTITTPWFVSSNGSINATATLSSIDGAAQAVGSISGNVTGSKQAGQAPRAMPGNTVFDYYLANGTWIEISLIPHAGGVRTIAKRVMSPTSNPITNVKNAEGIYVIDCQGQNLRIENSRIVGTLVVINPGPTCEIYSANSWVPVSPNFPVLMVRGNAQFFPVYPTLSEALMGSNFNPAAVPYEGISDNDTNDEYPSRLMGLTYISGTLRFRSSATGTNAFDGCVIAGAVQFDSIVQCQFLYRSTHLEYPPPGFANDNPLQMVPGTWQRSTLP